MLFDTLCRPADSYHLASRDGYEFDIGHGEIHEAIHCPSRGPVGFLAAIVGASKSWINRTEIGCYGLLLAS